MVTVPGTPEKTPAITGEAAPKNAAGIPTINIHPSSGEQTVGTFADASGGGVAAPVEHQGTNPNDVTDGEAISNPPEYQVAADTSVTNDASTTYVKAKTAQTFEEMMQANRDALAAGGVKPPEKPADPSDPHGISLGGALADIGKGILQSPHAIVAGTVDATRNTLLSLASLADSINQEIDPKTSIPFKDALNTALPKMEPELTNTGTAIRDTSAFATGFIPALRGLRAVTGGAAAVGTVGALIQSEAAGAFATALVFDPHESRLSNLIQSYPSLANPITDFLQAKDSDSETEGRIKNALEGLGISGLFSSFVAGVRAIRANRIAKGMNIKERGLGEPDANIPSNLGEPKGKFLTDEAAVAVATGGASPEDLAKGLNFSQLGDEAAISKAVDKLAKAIKSVSTEGKRYNFLKKQLSVDSTGLKNSPDIAIMDTANSNNIGRTAVVSDPEVQRLADNLGVTPEDLLGKQKFLNGNRAIDAERIHAINSMVDAATIKLQELAKIAANSDSDMAALDFTRMLNIHAGIQLWAKGYAAEAGRALRAFQIPTGSLNKQIAEAQEQLMRNGGPAQVRRLAGVVAQMDSPTAINKAAAASQGSKLNQAVTAYWYFDLLSGWTTQAANALGNAIHTVWSIPERYLAAQYSRLMGNDFGVVQGEASAMYRGLISAFTDGIRINGRNTTALQSAFHTLKTGEISDTVSGKNIAGRGKSITAQKMGLRDTEGHPTINASSMGFDGPQGSMGWYMGKAMDALGAGLAHATDAAGIAADVPSRALATVDELFRTMGKSMELHAQAVRKAAQEDNLTGAAAAGRIQELLNTPTADMRQKATDFSRYLTFNTPPGPIGRSIEDTLAKVPFGKVVVPFFRVSNNMTKWTLSRTPLAPMAKSIMDDISKGGAEGDMAVARIAMGSMVSLAMANAAFEGLVTGAGPADPVLYKQWYDSGKRPYSFKIGDQYYSYNRLNPVSNLAGLAAAYGEMAAYITDEDKDKVVSAIAMATSKQILDTAWVRGAGDLFDALHDWKEHGAAYVERQIGALAPPNVVAQITKLGDPVVRDTKDKSIAQTIINEIKSRTPGLSKDLPPVVDLWGHPQLLEGALGRDIVSPIYESTDHHYPINDFMIKNKVAVDKPPRNFGDVNLSVQEYHQWSVLAGNDYKDNGKGMFDYLNDLVSGSSHDSANFNKMTDGPDGGKALVIRDTVQAYRQAAWADMIYNRKSPNYNPALAKRVSDALADKQTKLTGQPSKGFLNAP